MTAQWPESGQQQQGQGPQMGTRRPFTGPAGHSGRHGGELTVHRFGTDGDWAACTVADIRLVAEMIYIGSKGVADFHCTDCRSIVTQLRHPGQPGADLGITHSPGCPWLTANAREIKP